MGGVDLADLLIALYRTTIKSKRWYVKVFFHCVDIAKVNAWFLYRRHFDQHRIPKKSQMLLLKFASSIALALTKFGTIETPRSAGRPRSSVDDNPQSAKKRKVSTGVPIGDIRHDNIAHWPEFCPTKSWNWSSLLQKVQLMLMFEQFKKLLLRLSSKVMFIRFFFTFLNMKTLRYFMFLD